MKNAFRSFVASTALALSFACPVVAQAGVVTVNFTASGFDSAAPQDVVSGSFSYQAASPLDVIQQLLSVNLTIDGHAYSVAELGFVDDASGKFVGGLVGGVLGGGPGTDDFLLTAGTFGYASSASNFIGFASNFTLTASFADTVSQVPEPSSLALLGLGLAGLAGLSAARKRKQA